MMHIFNNEIKNKAYIQKQIVFGLPIMSENKDKFTLAKMTEKLDEIMENHMKDIPQQVGLNLPKLKKINKEAPKVELPKLKKMTEVTV